MTGKVVSCVYCNHSFQINKEEFQYNFGVSLLLLTPVDLVAYQMRIRVLGAKGDEVGELI